MKNRREKTPINPGTDMIARKGIKELVAVYQEAALKVRTAFEMVYSAEKELNEAFTPKHRNLDVRPKQGRGSLHFARPDDSLDELQRNVWRTLVERLEMRRFMSIRAYEKMMRDIAEKPVLEITEENIYSMACSFQDNLSEMIEESVTEVYEWLRPWRENYKTNSPYQVGKKVILERVVDSEWSSVWGVNYSYEQKLIALENVFTSLDGKGFGTKNNYSGLSEAIKTTKKPENVGETEYFRFTTVVNEFKY